MGWIKYWEDSKNFGILFLKYWLYWVCCGQWEASVAAYLCSRLTTVYLARAECLNTGMESCTIMTWRSSPATTHRCQFSVLWSTRSNLEASRNSTMRYYVSVAKIIYPRENQEKYRAFVLNNWDRCGQSDIVQNKISALTIFPPSSSGQLGRAGGHSAWCLWVPRLE